MRGLLVVLVGFALGVATAFSDIAAGGLNQTPWDRSLSMLLNAGFIWAGAAVLGGWIVARSGRRAGAAAGFAALTFAVSGYYLYGAALGDRAQGGLSALSGVIRLWLLASVVAGPLLGLVGSWTRRHDLLGLVARLVVPVGAVVEMLVVGRLGPGTFRVDPALAWTQALVVVGATVGAAFAGATLSRSRSSQLPQ